MAAVAAAAVLILAGYVSAPAAQASDPQPVGAGMSGGPPAGWSLQNNLDGQLIYDKFNQQPDPMPWPEASLYINYVRTRSTADLPCEVRVSHDVAALVGQVQAAELAKRIARGGSGRQPSSWP